MRPTGWGIALTAMALAALLGAMMLWAVDFMEETTSPAPSNSTTTAPISRAG